MNRYLKTGVLIVASALLSTASLAQQAPLNPAYNLPMQLPYELDQQTAPMMPFAGFPTHDELNRLIPPEPLTEDKIKQRFSERKASLIEALEEDRQAAEQYARDFARYQKHQANRLAKMMAAAEQHRQRLLQDLETRKQQALQQFKQQKSLSTPSHIPEKKNPAGVLN